MNWWHKGGRARGPPNKVRIFRLVLKHLHESTWWNWIIIPGHRRRSHAGAAGEVRAAICPWGGRKDSGAGRPWGGAKCWASAGSATGEARGGKSLLFEPRQRRCRRNLPPMRCRRRRRCLLTTHRPELCSPRTRCYLLPLARHGASKNLSCRCCGLLLRPHGATSLRSAALGEFQMRTEGEKRGGEHLRGRIWARRSAPNRAGEQRIDHPRR